MVVVGLEEFSASFSHHSNGLSLSLSSKYVSFNIQQSLLPIMVLSFFLKTGAPVGGFAGQVLNGSRLRANKGSEG